LNICPKTIILRRTPKFGSDRLDIIPTDPGIASIKSVVTHINEPLSIMFIGFHTKNKAFCAEYKITGDVKRVCDIEIKINYVHFYLSLEGYPAGESEYLVAFLPRFQPPSELQNLSNEWKENLKIFRYL
jgi:hypothetical protein